MSYRKSRLFLGLFVVISLALSLNAAPHQVAASTSCFTNVTSANPLTENYLFGVAALNRSSVWAVGYSNYGALSDNQTLIEQWNGSAWSTVASPNPGGYDNNLNGVAVVDSSYAWAVGNYTDGSGGSSSFIVHWDGSSWTQVTSPNPATQQFFNGVAATDRTHAWAVGNFSGGPLIAEWHGTSWQQAANVEYVANAHLQGVAAADSTHIWAVGYAAGQTLIMGWDSGTNTWVRWTSPNPGSNNSLNAVTALSSTNAWAVGTSDGHTLILHWNGSSWSTVTSPNYGSGTNSLEGVAAVSGKSVWATGLFNKPPLEPFTTVWNGLAWSLGCNQGAAYNSFMRAVAVAKDSPTSAIDIWEVGDSWGDSSGFTVNSFIQEYTIPAPTDSN